MGAGQGLVEMVMRVDQARQHDVARSVEARVDRLRRRPPRDKFEMRSTLDDEAALGALARMASGSLIQMRMLASHGGL